MAKYDKNGINQVITTAKIIAYDEVDRKVNITAGELLTLLELYPDVYVVGWRDSEYQVEIKELDNNTKYL